LNLNIEFEQDADKVIDKIGLTGEGVYFWSKFCVRWGLDTIIV